MSGGSFEVKDNVLNRLANDLNNVYSAAESATSAMKSFDGGSSLGTSDLDSAAADFQSAWSYGLGKLKDDLKDTVQGLQATAQTYAKADAAIAQQLEQFRIPS